MEFFCCRSFRRTSTDKGKPVVKQGRKAKGLKKEIAGYRMEVFLMRRFIIASILIITMTIVSGFGFAESAIVYDFDETDTGIVRVKLDDRYEQKPIKIMVAYEGQNPEFYDYDRFSEFESYGVKSGEGTYQIGIYQNTSGNSYRALAVKSVEVKDLDPFSPYLASVQNIRWETGDEGDDP